MQAMSFVKCHSRINNSESEDTFGVTDFATIRNCSYCLLEPTALQTKKDAKNYCLKASTTKAVHVLLQDG